jgi:hypothetical protein
VAAEHAAAGARISSSFSPLIFLFFFQFFFQVWQLNTLRLGAQMSLSLGLLSQVDFFFHEKEIKIRTGAQMSPSLGLLCQVENKIKNKIK